MSSKAERELIDHELFDTSDIKVDMRHSKTRNQVTVTLDGDKAIGLMRYYLIMKEHVDQIELSLNIMKDDDGEH